jgi:hypothetical protein
MPPSVTGWAWRRARSAERERTMAMSATRCLTSRTWRYIDVCVYVSIYDVCMYVGLYGQERSQRQTAAAIEACEIMDFLGDCVDLFDSLLLPAVGQRAALRRHLRSSASLSQEMTMRGTGPAKFALMT